jgi:hypothetical protein
MVFATWINDVGEIVGIGVDKKTDQVHAFLAKPTSATPATAMAAPRVLCSPRQLLEQRLGASRSAKHRVIMR